MISGPGIKVARIIRPADESGHVHVERVAAGANAVIESIHVFRLRWETPEEEAEIFGATSRTHDGHHLPGPWWIKPALLGGYRIYSRLCHIATVQPQDHKPAARATARLIAAAPELLTTLSELEFALRKHAAVYEEHKSLLNRARGLSFRIKREG